LLRKVPTFYLISSIYPVFQVTQRKTLAQSGKYVITVMLSKRLSCSLKDTTVDRYLLSNFPAINVRMTHIPFTPE
jgi:hypothetical protein